MSTLARAKMPQNVLYEDVTSCQFFLPGLYAIKGVVVAYLVLAYNIAFFKMFLTYFPCTRFLYISLKRDPRADIVREVRILHG